MQTCAFVTYNTVGENGLTSGWHDGPDGRRALVLQNTRGERQAATTDPLNDFLAVTLGDASQVATVRERRSERRRDQIDTLWGKLQEALPELDHIVVYLGARGSERALELAAGSLAAGKVTLVSCGCGLEQKAQLVEEYALQDCGRRLCECGGYATMWALYNGFMATGDLP